MRLACADAPLRDHRPGPACRVGHRSSSEPAPPDRLTLPDDRRSRASTRRRRPSRLSRRCSGALPPVLRIGAAVRRTPTANRRSSRWSSRRWTASRPTASPGPTGRVVLDDASQEASPLGPSLARWIDRRTNGPDPLEPPWARPGWFARASAWMTDRLEDAAGSAALEPPRHRVHVGHLDGPARADLGRRRLPEGHVAGLHA